MYLPILRSNEIRELEIFSNQSKSGFMYLRGRRRVGKSWLLLHWINLNKNYLYFSGKRDASQKETIKSFIQTWSSFSNSTKLFELRSEYLTWDRIFQEMTHFEIQKRATSKTKQVNKPTLVFDEIQWIAKDGSGFIGSLKAAWILIEMKAVFNIIVCGSSNKFFSNHVGGEEKILRGIATRSPLWIEPIPLAVVQKKIFPTWSKQEIALLYMIMGGIPYYLERIDPKFGFIQAINLSLFSKNTIFTNEINEILGLEFNKAGLNKVKQILEVVGIFGSTQSKIRKTLNLSSSTVSDICEKLLDYEILYTEENDKPEKGKESRLFLKDFYLNFYFSIYKNYLKRIGSNEDGKDLIFSEILSKNGYYIETFTGKAFENLVRFLISTGSPNSKLFKKLCLKNNKYYSIAVCLS